MFYGEHRAGLLSDVLGALRLATAPRSPPTLVLDVEGRQPV